MSVPEVTMLWDLTLIVAGISPALPSLFWMMVLLSLFVFGCAVFTATEVTGKDPTCRLCFTVPGTEEEARVGVFGGMLSQRHTSREDHLRPSNCNNFDSTAATSVQPK